MKICAHCGASSEDARLVTIYGEVCTIICVNCREEQNRIRFMTPERKEARRLSNAKCRLRPEAKIAARLAVAKYQATPEGRAKSVTSSIKSKAKRLANDPCYMAKQLIRNSVRSALTVKGYKKNSKSAEILGADFETVMVYLNCSDGIPKGMVIDHKLPMALARNEADALTLNHYTNLQLLSVAANKEKSDWVPGVGCRARDISDEQAMMIVEEFRQALKLSLQLPTQLSNPTEK